MILRREDYKWLRHAAAAMEEDLRTKIRMLTAENEQLREEMKHLSAVGGDSIHHKPMVRSTSLQNHKQEEVVEQQGKDEAAN